MSMTHSDVAPNAPTPSPLQPPDFELWDIAPPFWVHLADLPEIIERASSIIPSAHAKTLLQTGIRLGMMHAPNGHWALLNIPHQVEVGQGSRKMFISIKRLGGVDAIEWATGTARGCPVQVESTAVYIAVMWYLSNPEGAFAFLQRPLPAPPAARRDPEIDAMLADEPKLTATGAVKFLIVTRQLVGQNVNFESVVRRLVKGYLASKPEMRRRSG
jgi:hypothetical protein